LRAETNELMVPHGAGHFDTVLVEEVGFPMFNRHDRPDSMGRISGDSGPTDVATLREEL